MPRIRTIKPDFFMHEGLAELSFAHRLFFAGLWTLADREGRLELRPKRIKAQLFPWDDVDVEALLVGLAEAGFVVTYEVAGAEFISIPKFEDHQRPHPKEVSADLPPPPPNLPSRLIPRLAVKRFSSIPSCPAGKEILESGKEILDNGEWEPTRAAPVERAELFPASKDDGPLRMVAVWNDLAPPKLPRAQLTEERRHKLRGWLKKRTLGEWEDAVRKVASSPFLSGDKTDFRASLDWLLKPGNRTKTLEGNYDDPGARPVSTGPACARDGCEYFGSREFKGETLCERHFYEAFSPQVAVQGVA